VTYDEFTTSIRCHAIFNEEKIMITAIVEYKLPTTLPRDQVQGIFKMAEGKFRGMDGLEKKYFTYDEKTGQGLSVYFWSSLEKAQQCFTPEFAAEFESIFKAKPSIKYMDTLMLIDNIADQVSFY
jgi:hypothetical protein